MNRFIRALPLIIVSFLSTAAAQPVSIPAWVKDAVFYQIFPERFANGDTTNDPPNVEGWGGVPKPDNYFGGDLRGIIEHLDYLSRLGVNAIYLNPVFESPTNHKYQTTDYLKIDHNFGDEKTFRELIDACHRRKMHIVIDGVFNHTGTHFFAFEDVKKNGQTSPYAHWYNIHSFPVGPPDKPNYECWWGLGRLPKLMTDTPAVREYLFGATRHWTEMGIDGWRLDVANEISHEFWIQWRKLVKSINPDCYIVGEIWDDATPWLHGDQFDAVMNYRFRGACVGFIALENRSASQFDSILGATRREYPVEVNYALQNLIGSHDTERFLTLAGSDTNKLKLASLVQMTYVGAPMIYYGDEIGMEGGKDPDCRRTMIWDTTRWNAGLLRWYQKVIRLRNEHSVFRRGDYATLFTDDKEKMVGFKREEGSEIALVILNEDRISHTVPAAVASPFSTTWYDPLNGREIHLNVSTSDSIAVPMRSGMVLLTSKGK